MTCFDAFPVENWYILETSYRERMFPMQKTTDLQDLFLARARNAQESVTMFLMNGFQMRGKITGFDSFVVVLDTDGKQQVIYKHAISTVVPTHVIDLTPDSYSST